MPLNRTFDPRTGPLSRRRFVQGVAAAGSLAGLGTALGSRQGLAAPTQVPTLSGSRFDLVIGPTPVNITGHQAIATAVNSSVPAPILRWRQGDTITLNVTNRLDTATSIHWHGIRSPANMDGVPGLSFPGIAPGETFVYRIPIRQSGTYWYHSHSGYQEQTGLYGALIIEPKAGYPVRFDRDYVVLLSDWTDTDPETVVSNLKFQSDYYNFHQRTVGTFFSDAAKHGLGPTVADRLEWGRMRMSPTDILDVSGSTYTYLLNGAPQRQPIRLRVTRCVPTAARRSVTRQPRSTTSGTGCPAWTRAAGRCRECPWTTATWLAWTWASQAAARWAAWT